MSNAKQIVAAHSDEYKKLYYENKLAEMIELYAPDAKVMPSGKPTIVGREAIKDYYQSGYDAAYVFKMSQEEVLELGSEAILDRGQYTLLNGEQVVHKGTYVIIYKKIDGKWLIYIESLNKDQS